MKLLLGTMLAFCSASMVDIASARGIYYKIEIQNLTKGQPLTPPVVAVHSPKVELLEIGQKASNGIATLAKDGDTSQLVKELDSNYLVKRYKVGEGITLPGATQTIEVEANDPSYRFSIVSMLARTNDAILVLKNIDANSMNVGDQREYYAKAYDAGAEINTELCSDIPAPPCENPNSGPAEGEGFIHPHPGIQNIGDLKPIRDAFGSVVAKVTIERIK